MDDFENLHLLQNGQGIIVGVVAHRVQELAPADVAPGLEDAELHVPVPPV